MGNHIPESLLHSKSNYSGLYSSQPLPFSQKRPIVSEFLRHSQSISTHYVSSILISKRGLRSPLILSFQISCQNIMKELSVLDFTISIFIFSSRHWPDWWTHQLGSGCNHVLFPSRTKGLIPPAVRFLPTNSSHWRILSWNSFPTGNCLSQC